MTLLLLELRNSSRPRTRHKNALHYSRIPASHNKTMRQTRPGQDQAILYFLHRARVNASKWTSRHSENYGSHNGGAISGRVHFIVNAKAIPTIRVTVKWRSSTLLPELDAFRDDDQTRQLWNLDAGCILASDDSLMFPNLAVQFW